ncbi:phage terminase small subunit P27 family [Caldanaerobius polysaccharolyticus]|uniref:phage terminase small subunit P27 family n=1 Tax=Caldanaerobius polysaccharolyticus TaxID=44256 RepID=UPI00047D904D|nr:phage terminase small subunit P27 family [Caldanaerobius polysaccharolyticus]
MGRKAKPITLHLLEGKKHLTKAEIEQRLAGEQRFAIASDKIKPPKWLNKTAKKEFNRIVKEMAETGLLTNIDVDALAIYCDALSQYIECCKIIEREGLMVEYTNKAAETNKVPHPLLSKKKQLFEQMKAIASEFGFTPSARAKIAIPKQEEKEETKFDRLFGDV